MDERFVLVLCLVLGLVFLVSGVMKILDTGAFNSHISSFGLPYPLPMAAPLIPVFEVLLAVALFLPGLRKDAGLVALIALAFFTLVFFYGYFFANVRSCQCFGMLRLNEKPIVLVLRNLLLAAAAFFVWRGSPISEVRPDLGTVSVFILAILLTALSVMSTTRPLVINTPLRVGDDLSGHPLAKALALDPAKRYLLFFFGLQCDSCWNSVENVKAFHRGDAFEVIGVSAGPTGGLEAFREKFGVDFPIKMIDDALFFNSLNRLPMVYMVDGDRITHTIIEPLMSPHTFALKFGRNTEA